MICENTLFLSWCEKLVKEEMLWKYKKQTNKQIILLIIIECQKRQKITGDKPYGRKLVKEINYKVVFLVRYSGAFVKWTVEELKEMDQRTRKPMIMHKALYPRDDVDRLYVSMK